jgi:hypothetical protein
MLQGSCGAALGCGGLREGLRHGYWLGNGNWLWTIHGHEAGSGTRENIEASANKLYVASPGCFCFSEALACKIEFKDWRVTDVTVTSSVRMSVPALAAASGRNQWAFKHKSEGWMKGIVRDSAAIKRATPLRIALACPV